MKKDKSIPLLLGVVASGISTGVQAYSEFEILNLDYRIILVLTTLIISFSCGKFSRFSTFITGLYISLGVITGLLARLMFDFFTGTLQHPFWSLEIAVFTMIAFPSAFIGAYLAELVRWRNSGS